MRLRGELTDDDGQRFTFDGTLTPVHEHEEPPPPPPTAPTFSGRVSLPGMLHVAAGEVVEFDPDANTVVEVAGPVHVAGTLRMRPNPGVTHVLRMVGIDESTYQGGGHHGDPGMFIMRGGVLDAHGAAKTPWTRLGDAARSGEDRILVESAEGWQVGDEITVTPTGDPRTDSKAHLRYDTRTVTVIDGNYVGIDRPLNYSHPSFTDERTGTTYGAEVLNLSRSVRIEGTPEGRAHVMAHDRQDVSHVELRWMGPRGVLGRYGFHFHLAGDASRGSVLDGVVVRDCDNHALVVHGSHGVTLRGCISHDTLTTPYWWDGDVPTNDVRWESCVASLIRHEPAFRAFRATAFALANGDGNECVGCVAVGLDGAKDSSGYLWPEAGSGVWLFTGCVAHNNSRHGIFTWQNNNQPHVVEDFVCYRNGGAGVSHGAYVNAYAYRDGTCAQNREAAFLLHSNSATNQAGDRQTIAGCLLDASGGPSALTLTKHTLSSAVHTLVDRCDLRGYTVAAVRQEYDGSNGASTPDLVDLHDCTYARDDLPRVDLSRSLPGSLVRELTDDTVTREWKAPR